MYVCLCNGVTESTIRRAAQSGIRTVAELAMATGCTAGCGSCVDAAQAALDQALSVKAFPVRMHGFSAVPAFA